MSSLDIDVLHAFKMLGVSDEEAEKAAMALHKRDQDVVALKADMAILKWMVGTNVALTFIVLGRLFTMHG